MYVPEAELIHYESVSKEGAGGVRPGEFERLRRKWGSRYFVDPYYNPNLPSGLFVLLSTGLSGRQRAAKDRCF